MLFLTIRRHECAEALSQGPQGSRINPLSRLRLCNHAEVSWKIGKEHTLSGPSMRRFGVQGLPMPS